MLGVSFLTKKLIITGIAYKLEITSDGKYGSRNKTDPNSNWSGMIGDLIHEACFKMVIQIKHLEYLFV